MDQVTMQKQTFVYKDFWFKIIGCIIASEMIDSLGRSDSFFQRMTTLVFYKDLVAGFVISLLLWEIVRFVVRRLDKNYDWLRQPLQRILFQLAFGVIIPAFLCFVFTMLFMQLAYQQDIFKTTWLYSEFYAVILIIVLINVVYLTWWLYLHSGEKQSKTSDSSVETSDSNTSNVLFASIEVAKGNVNFLLLPEEVGHVILKESYSFITTHEGQSFVTSYALDELHKKLGDESFFRANRQVIISRKSCKSYSSIENGKIRVEIVPPEKEPVIISQKRAKEFRKWVSREKISSTSRILQT